MLPEIHIMEMYYFLKHKMFSNNFIHCFKKQMKPMHLLISVKLFFIDLKYSHNKKEESKVLYANLLDCLSLRFFEPAARLLSFACRLSGSILESVNPFLNRRNAVF